MAKNLKTVIELEAMILKELRAIPKCVGVSMVTVRPMVDGRGNPDWKIGHVNYGTAFEEDCNRSLRQITERLRSEFTLARKYGR